MKNYNLNYCNMKKNSIVKNLSEENNNFHKSILFIVK